MPLLTRPRQLPALARMTVTLYTRAQCCCCRSAREALEAYQESHGFALEEVDASNPSFEALIGPTVPVIAVDGKVRFRGEVNRVLFERLLEARSSTGPTS
jgi:glutaredoxin